jgi:hypothetical protein
MPPNAAIRIRGVDPPSARELSTQVGLPVGIVARGLVDWYRWITPLGGKNLTARHRTCGRIRHLRQRVIVMELLPSET